MSTMRAAVLANFPDLATRLGLDAQQALQQVGLSLDQLAAPDLPVPSDAVVSLIEDCAARTGCDTFGLQLSQPRTLSGFGVVGLLLAQQPTMRVALHMVLRYLPLINPSLALRLEQDGEMAVLAQEVLTITPQAPHHTLDLALAASLTLFRSLLGAQWAPRCAYFRHPAPASLQWHHRIFRCRCVFNSDFNGISFTASELDQPNPAADPVMARYAEQVIGALSEPAGESCAAQVRRLIQVYMPLQRANLRAVAQSLACSARKLQLDLAAEQCSFEQLLDAARWERAQLYLQHTRYNIDQIASLLGYTHSTSFTRWFRSRSGSPPSAWRQPGGTQQAQTAPEP